MSEKNRIKKPSQRCATVVPSALLPGTWRLWMLFLAPLLEHQYVVLHVGVGGRVRAFQITLLSSSHFCFEI